MYRTRTPHAIAMEQTLVILKPDAVIRGLVGEILERFEKAQLKIVGLKMLWPTPKQVDAHLPSSTEWLRSASEKCNEECRQRGIEPKEYFSTNDPLKIGRIIRELCMKYYLSGPLIVVVIQGVCAISTVRKMIGHTLPHEAAPGTIRGDYSSVDTEFSNAIGSPAKNLIHASGTPEEAEHEIACWFAPEELLTYEQNAEEYQHAGNVSGWSSHRKGS